MSDFSSAPAPAFPMARAPQCPFDPPPELVDRMADCPVGKVRIWDGSTPWLLTRYDDIRSVLGASVSANGQHPNYPTSSPASKARRMKALDLTTMDDPDHAQLRRLVTGAFTVRKIEQLRPRIREIVSTLIDDLESGERPADIVRAFALSVPSLVICEMLGVPYSDHGYFHDLTATLFDRTTPFEDADRVLDRLRSYLGALLDDTDPRADNLAGHLVSQTAIGALSAKLAIDLIQVLLIAGHETTANQIALSAVALLKFPEMRAELMSDHNDAWIANAVEELLRFLTISHLGMKRIATSDLEFDGVVIRAGDGMILANSAGNRDPVVFADADALDLSRPAASQHLTFGYGIHRCLGQHLARVELQESVPALFRRIEGLRLAVPFEQIDFMEDHVVYGVRALPVTWGK